MYTFSGNKNKDTLVCNFACNKRQHKVLITSRTGLSTIDNMNDKNTGTQSILKRFEIKRNYKDK